MDFSLLQFAYGINSLKPFIMIKDDVVNSWVHFLSSIFSLCFLPPQKLVGWNRIQYGRSQDIRWQYWSSAHIRMNDQVNRLVTFHDPHLENNSILIGRQKDVAVFGFYHSEVLNMECKKTIMQGLSGNL
jgi:hypothetical protein